MTPEERLIHEHRALEKELEEICMAVSGTIVQATDGKNAKRLVEILIKRFTDLKEENSKLKAEIENYRDIVAWNVPDAASASDLNRSFAQDRIAELEKELEEGRRHVEILSNGATTEQAGAAGKWLAGIEDP